MQAKSGDVLYKHVTDEEALRNLLEEQIGKKEVFEFVKSMGDEHIATVEALLRGLPDVK